MGCNGGVTGSLLKQFGSWGTEESNGGWIGRTSGPAKPATCERRATKKERERHRGRSKESSLSSLEKQVTMVFTKKYSVLLTTNHFFYTYQKGEDLRLQKVLNL